MNQLTDNPPAWFPESGFENESAPRQLWSVEGTLLKRPKVPFWKKPTAAKDLWIKLYSSKEEAEAHAVVPSPYWVWNGEPATPSTVEESLWEARSNGNAGVEVLAYRDGQWVIIGKYRADVPYIP